MLNEESIKRIINRERVARKQAERILEEKTLELFNLNTRLKQLNQGLEEQIANQTQNLRESEVRFRSMVESSSDLIIKATSRGVCTYINPAVTYTLGYLESEIIGKQLLSFVPIEHRLTVTRFYRNQFEVREDESYLEFPVMAKNKKQIWIGQKVHFTLKKGKEVKELIAVAREITERKLAEEMIRRSEEKYRGIIENMDLGLMEVTRDGIIKEAFDGFCRMTGYSREELENEPVNILIPGGRKKNKHDILNPDASAKNIDAYEMQIKTKGKGLIWVLISSSPTFNELGEQTGVLRIHMNITEQKRMQEHLLQAKLLAEKSRRAEQEFLANMSHEIRTPLNSIIGMTELLFDTAPNNEQKDYLEVLAHSSKILQNLISAVLDISKIEAGQWIREDAPFNLNEVVEAQQKSFSYRLQEKQIGVTASVDQRIRNYMIGDKSWLNQILVNLLGNAAKFTENGSITLTVKLVKSQKQSRWIEFRVKDTGIGIEKDALGKIFDSFKQGHEKISHSYGGTGLGLAISKKLVELQGGEISVESTPGKGSVFKFSIPYIDSEVPVSEAPSINDRKETEQYFHDLNILIVEDNELNHVYMERILKKWNVTFMIANDGGEAMELVSKNKFDMILMDIQMPVMNGYETTKKIRQLKNNANAGVPIIALTASALLDERKKAMQSGMNEHLAKPFRPDQLFKVISKFVDERKVKSTNAGKEEDILDTTQLEAIYGNDHAFMQAMIRKFLCNTPEYLKRMKDHIYQRNWNDLEKVAHKCKPTFGMVGLTHLQRLVEEIEQQSKGDKNIIKSERLLEQIIMENQRAKKHLERLANTP